VRRTIVNLAGNVVGVNHPSTEVNLEPEVAYTFGNTQFGRKYYKELIGKERLAKAKPRRKKKAVGQAKQAKGKARNAKAKR
jgi:hypothetical protein